MPSKESLEKIYFKIIEWGVYLSLFTPLIFIRDYFFPFVVPKTIFFRIIVDIIFIAYVLLAISNPRYRPRFSALTISVTVFLAIIILTSFTGVDLQKSFWSVFERMTGILTFLHLYAFFIVLSSVFKEKKYWERILTASICVGMLICFYTLTATENATRGGGTLGNTSFFSAYILFDIFFTLILLVTKSGLWRILYGIALLIFTFALFSNPEPTQGAIAAFLGGLFILGFGYLLFHLFSSQNKNFKKMAFALIILLILGTLLVLQLDFFKTKISDILQSGSIQSRMIVWQIGWDGWKERLLLGWGQENFNIPFAKYFIPELPLTQDIWYDRVHNIILDTGVTSGILGLLSYLSIFVVSFVTLFKLFKKIIERRNVFFPLGMVALLAVYLAQNIWVFDMISSYVMFFLSLAFINFLTSSPKEKTVRRKSNPLCSFVGALLIIATITVLYFGNVQVARASRAAVRGLYFPLEQSIASFEKAFKLSPISKFEIPEQISVRIIELASQTNQDKTLFNKGLALAEEKLKDNIEQNPFNFRYKLFLGRFYNNLYQITGDKEKLSLAEETMNQAEELSPRNEQVYWVLGQTYLFEGKYDEAIISLKKGVDLEPRLAQSHWYLSLAYRASGKYDLALQEVKEAEKLGYNWKGSINDLKNLADLYKLLGDNATFISILETGTQLYSNDVQIWGNLADAYASSGEREKAKNAAEKILELRPDLKTEIEDFLKKLGY